MTQNKWRISEKVLEDSVCAYPESWFWEGVQIIARQVQLPHGVLDVLAYSGGTTMVIELKAAKLQERDIGQVLRYTYDVRKFLQMIQNEHVHDFFQGPNYIKGFDQTYESYGLACLDREIWQRHGWDENADEPPSVQPTLIGTGVSDSVLAAATAASIDVSTWAYNEKENMFVGCADGWLRIDPYLYYPDWLIHLHQKITRGCVDDFKIVKETPPQLLFDN